VKKNTIQGVILFGSLAIIGIIIIQTYLVLTTWNLEEGKFHEKARIALLNVAVDLAELNDFPLPSQNLVNQLEPDYYVVNINNVIDANNLEYYLQKELEAVALSEDFEYGIYDCANQEMVYGKYINYPQKDSEKEKAKTDDLPTYDEFEILLRGALPYPYQLRARQYEVDDRFFYYSNHHHPLFPLFHFCDIAPKASFRDAKGFYQQHDP
jgi:hypothetical protein